MQVKIVDTTLRDGEQRAGIALGIEEKMEISKLIDSLDIYQIEAGVPAMGGDEKKSIEKICGLGLNAVISAWNRMSISDIQHSIDCGVGIVHISVPSSDIQIANKLHKTREWVLDNMKKCICFAKEKGMEVTVGFEDASRAEGRFLLRLAAAAFLEGVQRIRYADTVGILYRQRAFREIKKIKEHLTLDIEIHAHNDFGMAISNSISSVKAGAMYVNCTMGGIGERAGNCGYLDFIKSARGCLGIFGKTDFKHAEQIEKNIMGIMGVAKNVEYSIRQKY